MRSIVSLFLVANVVIAQPQNSEWQWATQAESVSAGQTAIDICTDRFGFVTTLIRDSGSVTYGNKLLTPGYTVLRQDNSGAFKWATSVPGIAKTIVADSYSNTYVGVNFSSSISIKNNTLTSAGGQDFLIIKLDHAGDITWFKQFGGIYNDECCALAIDNNNDLIMAGGGINFFLGTVNHDAEGYFVAKLDPMGTVLWSRTKKSDFTVDSYGDTIKTIYDKAYEVCTDKNGNIYILGTRVSNCDYCFGATFFYKYNHKGNPVLYRDKWGTYEDPQNINVDNEGFIYVVFNSGSHYTNSLMLGKYDSLLENHRWLVWLGDGYHFYSFNAGPKFDLEGNSIIAGVMGYTGYGDADSIQLDGHWCRFRGKTDLIVASIDKNTGTYMWAKSVGGSGYTGGINAFRFAGDMTTDVNGNIYVASNFNLTDGGHNAIADTCYFGPHELIANTSRAQVFVAKLKMNDLSFPSTVDLTQYANDPKLQIAPVPCSTEIRLISNNEQLSEVRIFDLRGEVVLSTNVTGNSAINVSDLSDGLYVVQVNDEKGTSIFKLIKTK